MIHKKRTTYIEGGKEQTHKRNQRGKWSYIILGEGSDDS